tara:strand:- start:999 stop:1124 length:126 start_codon:yes stop_codon:yes gene_type:complete
MASNKSYQQIKHILTTNSMGIGDRVAKARKPGNKQRAKQRS